VERAAKVARRIEAKTGSEEAHVQRGRECLRKARYGPEVPRPSNARGADACEREAFEKASR